jgi:hypothetical protein
VATLIIKEKGINDMKKDFWSIICMSLICATVMLGVMSIYKYVSPLSEKRGRIGRSGFAFEVTTLGSDIV